MASPTPAPPAREPKAAAPSSEEPVASEKTALQTDLEESDKKTGTMPPVQMSAMRGYLRVFTYGDPLDYFLEAIGFLAAIGSGTALAMVNLVIGNFISLLSNFTTGNGPPDNFMAEVSRSSLYFVYIGIARLVCTYLYSVILTYVAFKLTRNIRYHYLRSALSQEVSFFDSGAAGSISMQATSNGKLIQSGIAEKLGQIFQAVATLVAAFIIAFVSQWKLTLILICMIPALLIIVSVAGTFEAGIETKILKIYGQAASYAESVLSNSRATHAFNLGQRLTNRYSLFLRDARDLGNKKSIIYSVMLGGEFFVMFAGMGLAFWQGIGMIARGEVESIGTIFTVLFSVIIAAGTLNSVAPHMVTFSRAATAATELLTLIDRESSIDPLSESGLKPESTQGTIELKNVAFSYPSRPDVQVLQDFSLTVPAGKVTALVGSSGSGKSTIVGLLERWYNPDQGSLTLDGQPIDQLNLKWLRTNVKLVQQEPVLFMGSVFENISSGLVGTQWESVPRDDKMKRVKAAAKLAFADEFVEGLPQGYDTPIGERGGLLSGGQKQRIAIARSVISEPKILLLDEATSALDPHAEGIVQKALDEASKGRTTIVIAHKLKTIQNADNIVVMRQGKIVEQGRHAELVALGGGYAKLVKAQDLSPGQKVEDGDDSDESDDPEATKTKSLGRIDTAAGSRLISLGEREDYTLAPRTGIFRTVAKLVMATPELKMWYALVVATCIVGAGVYPGQALLLGNVMDVFGADNMQQRGNFISLMFFVMAIGLLIVYGIMGWGTNVISQVFSETIRLEMFGAVLRQDIRFFDRPENTIGGLTSRIDSYANAIFELMGFNIAIMLMSMVTVAMSGIMAIVISWKLGLVGVFAGIPPMILAGYVRIRVETKMDTDIDSKFSKSASVASESVMAIRTVSSLAIEEEILQKYTAELDTARRESKGALFTMMIFFSLTQAIEYFILALGFWWGSKLVSEGQISFYQFMVSFMSVYFAGQGCGQLFGFASSFTKANSAANYFFWLRDLTPTVSETETNRTIGPKKNAQQYEFENVQFAYPLAPQNRVLKGISLKIEPGQFVAFVGASGCGKSTMISLLERFYDPTSGRIIIDSNDDLADINPRLYRKVVSLVQQEPTLFPGSIRDNVSMGFSEDHGDTTDDAAIEKACRAANVWDFVCSLPEGLETPCGSSGSQLSGGQRQRVAIARALAREPSVMLLDEATSALDTESERLVQDALMDAAQTGDRITIAVAHRLSTIREAHRIFVFFGGRIVEQGTHNDLVAQGGMYAKMCEAQSLDGA